LSVSALFQANGLLKKKRGYIMFLKAFLELLAIGVFCYGVKNENKLIEFEHKVWFYVKAFFKSCYYTLKDWVKK
jgi:hypothetical protein